ncbi:MAG TPA: nuclear transport factor 2 family protein [Ktedonobacterales bacterium]|nr:nuclear transport factor 2 family protein [Ktedonobacterales bacterium]
MNIASLQAPLVRQSIEAINDGDIDDFMALFTPDAVVVDGPVYDGAAAIRGWAARETFGVHMRLDALRELNADGTTVELQATSTGGYNGVAEFAYSLRDGLIARLEIS